MITHGNEIKLFSGNSNLPLAKAIAAKLNTELGGIEVTTFSDGEINVHIEETVRGRDLFIIQSTCSPVNDNLMELLIMIDAAKRASAGRITAVVPYFGYARQDRKARSRDPITAKLVANLITAAGADRVLTMDLHAEQIQGFFDIPVDNLLGFMVDDMIDTAGTICQGAQALKDLGATEIYAACTHAVLSGPAVERLEKSPITKLVMLDTIHLPEEKMRDKFEVLSVADIFAAAIENVYLDKPMSKLYD